AGGRVAAFASSTVPGMDVVGLVSLVLSAVTLAVKVFALGDSLVRSSAAYSAVGRLPKIFWLIVLFLAAGAQVASALTSGLASSWASFGGLVGIIAALVYVFGMRPELIRYSPRKGRGSSSDGPYGPW
ncbi:MAG: DUF2516 family protein, partial [Actinomycetes bacterium]